jgi:hypothetical protein
MRAQGMMNSAHATGMSRQAYCRQKMKTGPA